VRVDWMLLASMRHRDRIATWHCKLASFAVSISKRDFPENSGFLQGTAIAETFTHQTEETPQVGMTMSNRGKGTGEESPGREVGVGDFDLEMLRLTSLGGGESRSAQYTGTKALMLAILEDGIRSYLSPVGRIRNEAEYWVKCGRQRSPFCFTVVCETLGLEPDAVRTALERMRVRNISPRQALARSRPNVRRTGRIMGRRTG
jgi:hypothetical protein